MGAKIFGEIIKMVLTFEIGCGIMGTELKLIR